MATPPRMTPSALSMELSPLPPKDGAFETMHAIQERIDRIFEVSIDPEQWTMAKKMHLAFEALYEAGRRSPGDIITKGVISCIALSAIYPAVIGSWACLRTLELIPLRDLESTDRATAMTASQGIGNVGMAVTYMVQLEEFVFHPITHLFINEYNRRVCEEITGAYSKILLQNRVQLHPCEIDLIIERENTMLSRYNGLPIADQVDISERQEAIEKAIEQKLSLRNILPLLLTQVGEDISHSSHELIAKKTAEIVVIAGLLGFISYVLIAGTYGCFKPFSLQNPEEIGSSDQTKVQNATANYANAGHGLEYVAVLGMLFMKAMKTAVGSQYKQVVRTQIREAYLPHIKAEVQKNSDLLYKRMAQTLANHKC